MYLEPPIAAFINLTRFVSVDHLIVFQPSCFTPKFNPTLLASRSIFSIAHCSTYDRFFQSPRTFNAMNPFASALQARAAQRAKNAPIWFAPQHGMFRGYIQSTLVTHWLSFSKYHRSVWRGRASSVTGQRDHRARFTGFYGGNSHSPLPYLPGLG